MHDRPTSKSYHFPILLWHFMPQGQWTKLPKAVTFSGEVTFLGASAWAPAASSIKARLNMAMSLLSVLTAQGENRA